MTFKKGPKSRPKTPRNDFFSTPHDHRRLPKNLVCFLLTPKSDVDVTRLKILSISMRRDASTSLKGSLSRIRGTTLLIFRSVWETSPIFCVCGVWNGPRRRRRRRFRLRESLPEESYPC